MSKYTPALAAFALFAGLPAMGAAQDLSSICSDLRQAEVGQWAEYEMDTPQGSGTMRMALLDEGAAPDEGQWFEMSGDVNGQSSTVQLLIGEYPFAAEDVTAVVAKMGAQPAMRLPEQMLGQMRSQMRTPAAQLAEVCDRSELVGSESVDVPAGSYDAHHLRTPAEGTEEGADVWVSADVPFGIVKTEAAGGTMVLSGAGSDATSTITETPGEMPGPPGAGDPGSGGAP